VSKIFISYRRHEATAYAGHLCDLLIDHYGFGPEEVFLDIDDIPPGEDFVEHIDQEVGSCDVLIALIGKEWLAITDETGNRRLDDPLDFVRHEIHAALERDVRVIPALLPGATMPQPHDLPDNIAALARRQAVHLGEASFKSDVGHLAEALKAKIRTDPEPAQVDKPSHRPTTISTDASTIAPEAASPDHDVAQQWRRLIAHVIEQADKFGSSAHRDRALQELRAYEEIHGLRPHAFHFESYAAQIREIDKLHAGKHRDHAVEKLRAFEKAHNLPSHHFKFERVPR
jgi:TIR domain